VIISNHRAVAPRLGLRGRCEVIPPQRVVEPFVGAPGRDLLSKGPSDLTEQHALGDKQTKEHLSEQTLANHSQRTRNAVNELRDLREGVFYGHEEASYDQDVWKRLPY
jgi:hypothetical protein